MSTYLSLYYHLTLSPSRRILGLSMPGRLRKYLGGLARGLGGEIHGMGGRGDQIHLLVSLRPTHCVAEFVKEFKKNSAAWIRASRQVRGFTWRRGYCALTVGEAGRAAVHKDLATPKARAHRMSLWEEFS